MITSNQNERVKQLRKLQDKKHRDATGTFAAEGEDLVRAALVAGAKPLELFVTPGAPEDLAAHSAAVAVEAAVLDSASALGSGSRVIGVFERAEGSLETAFKLAIHLDAIADPGNVGTILRSALAFADGPVLLGPGCADPYSPKAVRASMGAIFARPPVRADATAPAALPGCKVALDAGAETSVGIVAEAVAKSVARASAHTVADSGAVAGPVILCVGSERHGLSAETLAAADVSASIPMLGTGPESLNAAVAASIALYEFGQALWPALQTPVHEAGKTASASGKHITNEN